ncbi:hypothetical protein CTEN210_12606 [Chaetoceros tenuissimus]|uniref:Gfo/Idh/MocA-like oxidoreductase N-terminal domain-containing protein n=2 Tax=Chaetoceros tenuissimus TaxID=426638 RepID=A0AAD3D4Y4_9STRA|nr:hypothetical protein CTEN210_12606 [Chaetoceros tenuissimus]
MFKNENKYMEAKVNTKDDQRESIGEYDLSNEELVILPEERNEVETLRNCDFTVKVKIAVIGAGSWSQGWHIPHLSRHPDVELVVIVDTSPFPRATLGNSSKLMSLEELSQTYKCPTFSSVQDMLENCKLDGAVVCTPHHTHFEIGKALFQKRVNVFMEKPMVTNISDAHKLYEMANVSNLCFMINHTANYRPQARVAKELIAKGHIGKIRHIHANMNSPLFQLFNDPDNVNWVKPNNGMLGNGFAWGQSCHLVAWLMHVCGSELIPQKVFAAMNHSDVSKADISFSATIICRNGVNISLGGSALVPGDQHNDKNPVGKQIGIEIYGDEGSLTYNGVDTELSSGELKVVNAKGIVEHSCMNDGYLFENSDQNGTGPESLQEFIDACMGRHYYNGADSEVGLKTVQIVEAMYRSNASCNVVDIANPSRHTVFHSKSSRISLRIPRQMAASLGLEKTIATRPYTWDELKHIVVDGDPSMHARSIDVQVKYQLKAKAIRKEWRHMNDYILHSMFDTEKVKIEQDGPERFASNPSLQQVKSEKRYETRLHRNEFPYYICDGIEHWCLWKLGGVVTEKEVDIAIEELKLRMKKDGNGQLEDVLSWTNPPHLQSVPDIDHAHILCLRTKL